MSKWIQGAYATWSIKAAAKSAWPKHEGGSRKQSHSSNPKIRSRGNLASDSLARQRRATSRRRKRDRPEEGIMGQNAAQPFLDWRDKLRRLQTGLRSRHETSSNELEAEAEEQKRQMKKNRDARN